MPPEIACDSLYKGLSRKGETLKVSSSDFCLNPRYERVEDHPYYLATYVGEADGSLNKKLVEVSRLLDCPFDGLCVHKVPQLPSLGEFKVGVITGPSGSGKSSLVKNMFGFGQPVDWSETEPVLCHFSSLDRAREFCEAARLDLRIAMRPYQTLSGGEQSRAQYARLLDAAATAKESGEGDHVLVLEEFTSLVDRPVAKQMASSIQELVVKRGLKVVLSSCHSDFVGEALMEPQWLFECHNSRLLWFRNRAEEFVERAVAPVRQKLEEAQQSAARALAFLFGAKSHLELPGLSEFSQGFRELVAQLESRGKQELEAKQQEVDSLTREVARTRKSAVQAASCRKADIAEMPESCELQTEEHAAPPAPAVPVVELEVRRALPREWRHFREHHYKDHKLKGDSIAFVGLIEGRAACFIAITQEPVHFVRNGPQSGRWPADFPWPATWHSRGEAIKRQLFREHRMVVLPDFQGMGLAPLMCDAVACYFIASGNDFTSQTVHPFYGSYRDRSPFWLALPTNRTETSAINGNLKFSHAFKGDYLPDGSRDENLRKLLEARVRLDLS